jgi:putative hydrolase of the HAD superfamily
MIKAVFFDYDGVLTTDKTGSVTTNRFLSEQTGIPYAAISSALQRHNAALNDGKTDYAAVWPYVCADLRREIPRSLLLAAFESTPVNADMFELARDLKTRCSVGIITDNKKERMEHLRRFQRLDALFRPIVVSADVGSTKATTRIFEHALACLNVRPQDCMVIDNSAGNLAAAAALGMKTVHFDDESNDVAGLRHRLAADVIAA